MPIQLLEDRILVRREVAETVSAGGIIIPETVAEKPQYGDVVFVGPGLVRNGTLKPVQYQVGQKVLFGKWNEETLEVDGEKLMLLRENDILGSVE